MNVIAAVIVSIIILILVILLINTVLKIYDLEGAKQNLKNDNSKMSNALRKKGIEVDQLKKKIKRLEGKK